MLTLPEKYIQSIIFVFGNEGKDWLDNINKLLDKYIKKFNLINIKIIDNLSYNLVIFAECKEYGKVVLKIGNPDNETLREIITLGKYNSNYACKCYYSDKEDKVMLLEKLVLGETLNSVKNREERIKIFCDIASNLAIMAEENLQLPTYREILNRAFSKIERQSARYKSIRELINTADNFYEEIEKTNLSKYILHADLHHDNILTSGVSRKVIDPHGVIGEKVLETARFLENEIQKQEVNQSNIIEVIELMSKYYREDKKLIGKSLFIDYVLSTCWDIEGNFENEHVNKKINCLRLILGYLRTIN